MCNTAGRKLHRVFYLSLSISLPADRLLEKFNCGDQDLNRGSVCLYLVRDKWAIEVNKVNMEILTDTSLKVHLIFVLRLVMQVTKVGGHDKSWMVIGE